MKASGTFEVNLSPQPLTIEHDSSLNAGRMNIDKTYLKVQRKRLPKNHCYDQQLRLSQYHKKYLFKINFTQMTN